MQNQAIFDEVKWLLVERFAIAPAAIGMSATLQDELELDSMDALDLLLAVNEYFDIHMPDTRLENIHTVADLVAVIQRAKSSRLG